ncbi:DoxX family protein [Caldithrix abyssi DSM 13497]|uniref:DoxX family protein n=1 Tax=Caldithrix abyssi DSM 13497 TaxID=880073 RepID=H1XRU8_CALAY|nr:MauE/DoxX family redox-associated membrane protein [Caldithrix abyssi]APF17172.1 Methylamine utilization protein MauE [Caldithrix abyssi DSM 13497]EHO41308.1 DoxX family protein [Caldithrix abyssi DSM 13497]
MRNLLNNWRFQLILRIVLGLFLSISGVAKIMDLAAFGKAVNGFGLLPSTWVVLVTVIIPYLELILGLMLLLNFYAKPAYVTALTMLIIFTALSAYKYFSGDISDCGCFGKLLQCKTDEKLLIENALLMVLFALGFFKMKGTKNE